MTSARLILSGAAVAVFAVLLVVAVLLQRQADERAISEGMPYFTCAAGSRMYVDHRGQRHRVTGGEWQHSTSADPGYYAAYMACSPIFPP